MKRWLNIAAWAGMLLAVAALVGFVRAERAAEVCWRVDLTVNDPSGHSFVTNDMVMSRLLLSGDSLVGTAMDDIRCDQLQRSLVAMAHVRSAVVSKRLDGRIEVEVVPRQPILRVLNPDGSGFYVDADQRLMPLSSNYAAHVPLFVTAQTVTAANPDLVDARTGIVGENSAIADLVTYRNAIESHPLMQHLVEHVVLDSLGQATVVPRVGAYRIAIGDARNLEAKFDRLQTFLKHAVQRKDLNTYTHISLAYRDQVVCKRRW